MVTIFDCCASYGVLILLVYLIHVIHRVLMRNRHIEQPSYTLYLRKLQQSGADMLVGCETDNIFLAEYLLLIDLLFPKVDFSVMKALQRDIPLLSKQEHLHAKMHNQAKAERKRQEQSMKRWEWFIYLADLFLLRMGPEIGGTIAGFVESTSALWMYLPMALPFNRRFGNNEYVFHSMEELEHGPLTTQYLRSKLHPLSPLLLFPIAVVVFAVFFLFPPVAVLVFEPTQFFKLRNVGHLARYYGTFVPVFIATTFALVLYWVLPFRIDDNLHHQIFEYFADVAKDRRIKYEIVDKETYRIEGGSVKVGQK